MARRRHLKCDESSPTCHRCLQAGIQCERLEVLPRRTRCVSGFRAFKMIAPPHQPDDTPYLGDLDFFRHRTLPLLQKFQSSDLWDVSAPRLIRSERSFRSVAVALAHQQRLVEEPKAANYGALQEKANKTYADALSLVRRSIDANRDSITLGFQCLLLVILESLKGSQPEMIVHLHCGIRIVCGTPQHSVHSQDLKDIRRVLRQYGVSTMLMNPFSPMSRDLQNLMWQTGGFGDDRFFNDPSGLYDISNAVYRLILETLDVMYHVQHNNGQLGFEFCKTVARLRTESVQIEQLFEQRQQKPWDPESPTHALWKLTEARCLLAHAHLNYAWACNEAAFHGEVDKFKRVIDLLDSALSDIEKLEGDNSTLAFSVGLGVISALEMVAWRCTDLGIRKKAVQLLERCPRREGLWNANERSQLWRDQIVIQEEAAPAELPHSNLPVELETHDGNNGYLPVGTTNTVSVF